MKIKYSLLIVCLLGGLLFFWTYSVTSIGDFDTPEEPQTLAIPLGLPEIPWPADNAYSKEKAELGRLLYFDKRLSTDGTISCATCHSIPRAFTDNKPVSIGILERNGSRNSPTVINVAYQTHLFWDGRANSLEEQAKGPIGNPKEMTLKNNVHDAHAACVEKVRSISGYCFLFKRIFGEDCSIENIAKAIATFERSILSGDSPYDRYIAGDKSALTQEQIEGYKVFKRSACADCHFGPNFTDGRFLNIGVGMDQKKPDLGRYDITKKDKDWGAFKVPTLREVSKTYPYMHDGSIQTLEGVIDYYDKGGIPNRNLHPLMRPLHLSEKDKKALLAFLLALNGTGWQHFTEPKEFPSE